MTAMQSTTVHLPHAILEIVEVVTAHSTKSILN
jgi:hypothetical protein